MDCESVRQLFPFLAQKAGELDEQERLAVQDHLHRCPSCASQFQKESRFEAALQKALLGIQVPSDLKVRILNRLARERQASTWRWTAAAALAACLLVSLSFYAAHLLRGPELPPLDLNELSATLSQARSPDQVQEWLDYAAPSALWLPAELRDRWNFNLVEHHYVQYVGGHAVPTLVFRKDNHVTKVYLLKQGQYRTEDVAEAFDPTDPNRPWKLGGDGVNEYVAIAVRERGDWKTFLLSP
ncbi:MAG: hypothetical protein NZM31_10865 [Gemmatales bacterium]|nr:hypothetical protein [Gemmatales bacterium]MDW8387497.1 hypothetical protein [Gemmatales bacterium]